MATSKTWITRQTSHSGLWAVFGIIMPILSALIYPSYTHQLYPEALELSRLIESPFLICEILVIFAAVQSGQKIITTLAKLPRDALIALVFLLVGLTVGSVFFSRYAPPSVFLSITTLIHLWFCAAIYYFTYQTPRQATQSLFPWLTVGLAALMILTIFRFQFPPPATSVPGGIIEWSSALPGFISVRHFGSWSGAIAAGLMLSLLYGEANRQTSLSYALAFGLTCWSGTRAAILAMAVVALVALLSLRRWPNCPNIIYFAGLSGLSLMLALLFLPNDPTFLLYANGDINNGVDIATGGRLSLWQSTFERWLQSPLFGWGSGSTFWEVHAGWRHTQPHNFILQFLISWGLIGTAGGLWLLGRAIVAIHRTGMEDVMLRPLTGMLYALLFMSLLEGMLYYPRFIMMIAVGFAVLFAARERKAASPIN